MGTVFFMHKTIIFHESYAMRTIAAGSRFLSERPILYFMEKANNNINVIINKVQSFS